MEIAVETWGMTRVEKNRRKVDNLYLRIPSQSVYCLLGPDGSGKTTVLKMLLGLKKFTSGGGKCLGYDLMEDAFLAREKAALVEENNNLYSFLKVGHLLNMCRSFYPAWKEEIPEKYLKEAVPREKKVGSLSLPQKNFLALAISLAAGPEIVFIDEPSLQYDSYTRGAYVQMLKDEVVEAGKTLVMVSRYYRDVERMAHRVGLFYRGSLLQTLSPDDERIRERHIKVNFEQEPPPELLEQEGISRVHRIKKGDNNYLLSVVENFDAVWHKCHEVPHSCLKEIPVDFEVLLKPYLEEEGKDD